MKTLEPATRRSAGTVAERPAAKPRRATTVAWQVSAPEGDRAEWELVQRIVASRRFGRSTLLSDFLLFVTHRTLSGRASEINEQQIGVHVFARGEQFNPGDDNIVRSYARMLRKRLEEYFRHEGRDETLGLDMPRGAYVPVFSARSTASANPAEPDRAADGDELPVAGAVGAPAAGNVMPTPVAVPARLDRRRLWAGMALAMVLSAAAGFAVAMGMYKATLAGAGGNEPERLSHALWGQMFDPQRDTYVVPTDGGLVILRRFLEHPVTLSDYVSGSYHSEAAIEQGLESLIRPTKPADMPALSHKVETLGERRYTSMVDLDLTAQVARRPEVVPEHLLIRYARDLRMDDLRGSNVILIGSLDSNPWVELFQPQMNFQFTYGASFGGSAVILNKQPLAGEQPSYASVTGDPDKRTYGVIAYVPNLDGSGHVLIVEGINMAGTQAAGNFLMSAEKMEAVLERAMDANRHLRSFEVLLGTESIAANSSRIQVLSERVAKD